MDVKKVSWKVIKNLLMDNQSTKSSDGSGGLSWMRIKRSAAAGAKCFDYYFFLLYLMTGPAVSIRGNFDGGYL